MTFTKDYLDPQKKEENENKSYRVFEKSMKAKRGKVKNSISDVR